MINTKTLILNIECGKNIIVLWPGDAPIFMKKQKHMHALKSSAFRVELFEQLSQCLQSAFVKRMALACELCFTQWTKEMSLIRKKLAMVLFIRPLGKEKEKRKRKLEGKKKKKKKRNASKACNRSTVWSRNFFNFRHKNKKI